MFVYAKREKKIACSCEKSSDLYVEMKTASNHILIRLILSLNTDVDFTRRILLDLKYAERIQFK